MGSDIVLPPSELPDESFFRRNKVLWRAFVVGNFVLAAYLWTRPRKKDVDRQVTRVREIPSPASTASVTMPYEEPITAPPPIEPPKLQEPIPEDHQCELFKWLLEEKRKMKPKDREEKRCIDEDKAILKQFIRADSVPKF